MKNEKCQVLMDHHLLCPTYKESLKIHFMTNYDVQAFGLALTCWWHAKNIFNYFCQDMEISNCSIISSNRSTIQMNKRCVGGAPYVSLIGRIDSSTSLWCLAVLYPISSLWNIGWRWMVWSFTVTIRIFNQIWKWVRGFISGLKNPLDSFTIFSKVIQVHND